MKSHSYHVSIYKHIEQMNIFCSFFSNTLPSEPLRLVAWLQTLHELSNIFVEHVRHFARI